MGDSHPTGSLDAERFWRRSRCASCGRGRGVDTRLGFYVGVDVGCWLQSVLQRGSCPWAGCLPSGERFHFNAAEVIRELAPSLRTFLFYSESPSATPTQNTRANGARTDRSSRGAASSLSTRRRALLDEKVGHAKLGVDGIARRGRPPITRKGRRRVEQRRPVYSRLGRAGCSGQERIHQSPKRGRGRARRRPRSSKIAHRTG